MILLTKNGNVETQILDDESPKRYLSRLEVGHKQKNISQRQRY